MCNPNVTIPSTFLEPEFLNPKSVAKQEDDEIFQIAWSYKDEWYNYAQNIVNVFSKTLMDDKYVFKLHNMQSTILSFFFNELHRNEKFNRAIIRAKLKASEVWPFPS